MTTGIRRSGRRRCSRKERALCSGLIKWVGYSFPGTLQARVIARCNLKMAFTGFLRHGVVRLLAVLLVILNLHSGAPLSLSVDKPQSSSGDVVIVDSASNSLIAIVTCNTERQQNVNVVGNGSLYLQLVPNGNKPNVFFVLPNKTGTARLPEGNSSINISCGKLTAAVAVSIVGPTFAADVNQPYFTASPRFVRISADTLPGTVIANYKAEVRVHSTGWSVRYMWLLLVICCMCEQLL